MSPTIRRIQKLIEYATILHKLCGENGTGMLSLFEDEGCFDEAYYKLSLQSLHVRQVYTRLHLGGRDKEEHLPTPPLQDFISPLGTNLDCYPRRIF